MVLTSYFTVAKLLSQNLLNRKYFHGKKSYILFSKQTSYPLQRYDSKRKEVHLPQACYQSISFLSWSVNKSIALALEIKGTYSKQGDWDQRSKNYWQCMMIRAKVLQAYQSPSFLWHMWSPSTDLTTFIHKLAKYHAGSYLSEKPGML